MGYAADAFASSVANWLEKKWLPASGRIIEFGAQEFYCDQDEARSCTAKFLKSRGIDDETIRATLPADKPVSVAKIYRTLGIDYTAIDVDEAHGSLFYDLNTFAPPLSWREAFDFVNNEGTIEHLVNPINGFQVAHELLKVGGVAMHSIPLTGWRDHGIIYPTIKFYAYLIGSNRYEVLQSDIFIDQSELNFIDTRFSLLDSSGQPLRDIGSVKLTDAWLRLAVRKTTAAEFRAPYDHLLVDDPSNLGAKLRVNFSAYSRARLAANAGRGSASNELERRLELQPPDHEHADRNTRSELERQLELQRRDHEHADRNTRDELEYQLELQRRDHEHADSVAACTARSEFERQVELQRRDHEQADSMAERSARSELERQLELQRRDHAHADGMADYNARSRLRHHAMMLVIAAIIVLNGGGLLFGIVRPLSPPTIVAFSAGLLGGILPSMIAWTRFAYQPSVSGALVRYGAQLIWAAAALAFVAGVCAAILND
jgi:hypothetical protein